MKRFSATWTGALIVMEAKTHIPWVSRFFMGLGHRVIVAIPRKMKAISTADKQPDSAKQTDQLSMKMFTNDTNEQQMDCRQPFEGYLSCQHRLALAVA